MHANTHRTILARVADVKISKEYAGAVREDIRATMDCDEEVYAIRQEDMKSEKEVVEK